MKNVVLGLGVVYFVVFGACKVFGFYVTSSAANLADGDANLTIIVNATFAALTISVLLGVILKLRQIEDAVYKVTKQMRP